MGAARPQVRKSVSLGLVGPWGRYHTLGMLPDAKPTTTARPLQLSERTQGSSNSPPTMSTTTSTPASLATLGGYSGGYGKLGGRVGRVQVPGGGIKTVSGGI